MAQQTIDATDTGAVVREKLNDNFDEVYAVATDAELLAIAGVTSAANKLPYFTGSGAAAVADFTAAARALVDDADATEQRATLGLGSLATSSALTGEVTSSGSATTIQPLVAIRNRLFVFDDFTGASPIANSSPFARTILNAATLTTSGGEASHPGICTGDTGTNSAGAVTCATTNDVFRFGTDAHTYEASIKTPAALSDGTDTYTLRIGFQDGGTGAPTDGAYFRYSHGINGGDWQGVTISNTSEVASPLDTNTPVVAATWYRLTIVVNAAGTSVEFFIDGVSKGTLSSNIPTGAGRETGAAFQIVKSAGSTARALACDYQAAQVALTTPR